MVRDASRSLAREKLWPGAAQRDRDHAFPVEPLREMSAMGLMGVMVPEVYGGAAMDSVCYALALEEVAAGDGSCSTIMSVHNSVGCLPILRFGSQAQKRHFLPKMASGEHLGCFCLSEPLAGSDAGALATRAVLDGDTYKLNGTKQFVTSGSTAQIAIVFAVTDPSAGKRGISAFIVPTDTSGYIVARIERKLGQHASDTAQLLFEDMPVPAANRLGAEGDGYRIALANLEGGRIGIAAQSVGMARAAMECAIEYAKDRRAFGARLVDHQAIAFQIADMATRLEAARQMVLHAASLRDTGARCLSEASMAKLFASEAAEFVCSAALQILGGYGYLEDFPVERIYRDVRVCQIYEGASNIQKMLIARELIG